MRKLLLLVTILLMWAGGYAQIAGPNRFGLIKGGGAGYTIDPVTGVLSVTITPGLSGTSATGVPFLMDAGSFASQTADYIQYDGSIWIRSSGTVDSNPDNNPRYTALTYNGSGSNHYDRQYDGYAFLRWWRNISPMHSRFRYAMAAAPKLQVEDGTYVLTDNIWSGGNFEIRGNVLDPTKCVIRVTGSETRAFRGWFYYDGVTPGQIFENIKIEGFLFQQESTATTSTSYGPICFEGASTTNLQVNDCQYKQISTTAVTNFAFVKAGANRLVSDLLFQRCKSVNTGLTGNRFGRIGIEVINQDHPNNDQVQGQNVQIRQCNFGGWDYCFSVAGNFANTLIADNLIGSNTSYGAELAGNNINGIVKDNRFYGTQNVLFVSNYIGETGAAGGDYPITGGQHFIGNKTLGHVIGGYVEIRGGGDVEFSDNVLDIEGGIHFKKTALGGVTSAAMNNNTIRSTMVNSNYRSVTTSLFFIEGASNINCFGNILTRNSSDNTALIEIDGALAVGNVFRDNTLLASSGSYFGQLNAGTVYKFGNRTPTGIIVDYPAQPATFAAAKLLVYPGVYAQFRVAANEKYSNSPTISTYDGVNWVHSPADLNN